MRRMLGAYVAGVLALAGVLVAAPADAADPTGITVWADGSTTLFGPSVLLVVSLDEEPCCGQPVLWEWDLDNDGTYDDACPSPQSLLWSPGDYATTPGDYSVWVRATVGASVFTKEIVIPVGPYAPPPAFRVGLKPFGQYVVGEPGSLFLTVEDQPENTTLSLAWDLDNDDVYDDELVSANTFVPTVAGTYLVWVRARHSGMDPAEPSVTASAQITVAASPARTTTSARLSSRASSSGAVTASTSATPASVALTPVGITGAARAGQVLTATGGAPTPADAARSLKWLREGNVISGAEAGSYQLTRGDAGRRVAVRVSATRTGCSAASRTSPTVAVRALNLTRPTVTGIARVGRKLTGARGTWAQLGHTFSYRWLRDGRPITGATRTTYTTTRADRGHLITFQVTAKRAGFVSVIAKSVARRIS